MDVAVDVDGVVESVVALSFSVVTADEVMVCRRVQSTWMLVFGKIVCGLLLPPPPIGTLRCIIPRRVVSSQCVVGDSRPGRSRILVVLLV